MITLEKADLTKVAIFGGAGVDPDGLACVEAMTAIVVLKNPDAKILPFYNGKFDRPQNKTMRELLQLDHRPASEYKDSTCLISVDGPVSVCPVQPEYVIDHHPKDGEAKIAEDIRPVGACSSLMWEYCVKENINFTTEEGAKLATALAIGICTDTDDKCAESTCQLDWRAEAELGKYLDASLYNAIKNYPQPHYYADMYAYGWSRKVLEGTCLVTELGDIPEERTGVISTLAVEFSKFTGVTTTVIVAMVNGNFDISVRSTNPSLNVNDFCKSLGEGGGRKGAGRCKISMPLRGEGMFEAGYKLISDKVLQILGDGKRKDG